MHHFVSLRKDDALFVNGKTKHWEKLDHGVRKKCFEGKIY